MSHRTHMLEMSEIQMTRIAELLRADMLARPADYVETSDVTDYNPLTYLADCFASTVATLSVDYDPEMLHGFTL